MSDGILHLPDFRVCGAETGCGIRIIHTRNAISFGSLEYTAVLLVCWGRRRTVTRVEKFHSNATLTDEIVCFAWHYHPGTIPRYRV